MLWYTKSSFQFLFIVILAVQQQNESAMWHFRDTNQTSFSPTQYLQSHRGTFTHIFIHISTLFSGRLPKPPPAPNPQMYPSPSPQYSCRYLEKTARSALTLALIWSREIHHSHWIWNGACWVGKLQLQPPNLSFTIHSWAQGCTFCRGTVTSNWSGTIVIKIPKLFPPTQQHGENSEF